MTDYDPVNVPFHYNNHPSGVECRKLTVEHNFNVGNAIKYGFRWDSKGDPLENLRKMEVYLGYEVERLAEYEQNVLQFLRVKEGDTLIYHAMAQLLTGHANAVLLARSIIRSKISILEEDVPTEPNTEQHPGSLATTACADGGCQCL